ncbi:MAG: hypothetical protein JRH12_09610 [Deltaproteobacteria bacterium]|jgi:hypothetical protein|nr:hypothetical protein [Deltaproteobacteria bacterium]MBW2483093.1 hypothetical protein [Deltaproteobacteria bacterium]
MKSSNHLKTLNKIAKDIVAAASHTVLFNIATGKTIISSNGQKRGL